MYPGQSQRILNPPQMVPFPQVIPPQTNPELDKLKEIETFDKELQTQMRGQESDILMVGDVRIEMPVKFQRLVVPYSAYLDEAKVEEKQLFLENNIMKVA